MMLNLNDELWTKYASSLGKRTYALYQTAIIQSTHMQRITQIMPKMHIHYIKEDYEPSTFWTKISSINSFFITSNDEIDDEVKESESSDEN